MHYDVRRGRQKTERRGEDSGLYHLARLPSTSSQVQTIKQSVSNAVTGARHNQRKVKTGIQLFVPYAFRVMKVYIVDVDRKTNRIFLMCLFVGSSTCVTNGGKFPTRSSFMQSIRDG